MLGRVCVGVWLCWGRVCVGVVLGRLCIGVWLCWGRVCVGVGGICRVYDVFGCKVATNYGAISSCPYSLFTPFLIDPHSL